jgi:hypothetical protein
MAVRGAAMARSGHIGPLACLQRLQITDRRLAVTVTPK